MVSEICNNENLKADHTADGVLYTYQTGQEYLGIFPVWDWSRLPGTTNRAGVLGSKVRQQVRIAVIGQGIFLHFLAPLISQCFSVIRQGLTSFVGGLSTPNGSVAMSAMDYSSASFGTGDEGGVSAQKAWFFLPMGTVALAHNISGVASPAVEIVTTLEQSLLSNPGGDMGGGSVVSIGSGSGAPTVVSEANSSVPIGHWVHHDGKVYTPLATPTEDEWRLEIGDRSGSWMTINEGLDNTTDGETLEIPVFLLDVSHGPKPEGESLAYAVLPGVGPASGAGAKVVAFEASAKIVANSGAAQAVLATLRAGEVVLMVVVWPSATATTVDGGKPGLKVTLPKPANGGLLTVATGSEGTVFSAADPTNDAEGGEIVFTIDRSLQELRGGSSGVSGGVVTCAKAGAGTTVTVTLPTGITAGSTATGSC